jgi:ubiquinone/menaquinone biosynthesis C-methylase UbiE
MEELPMASHPNNPQAEQMADESMVRNLAAQAEAIWPQERELFLRDATAAPARVLDLGCGTGEITARLADLFAQAELLGVDLDEAHLERARARCEGLGGRVRFRAGDALGLDEPDGTFDLVVCRHLLQAVPEPARLVLEMARLARPGGRLHLLAEHYGMIHFHPTRTDTDRFWREGPMVFARSVASDLCVGRKAFTWLVEAGLEEVTVDYVMVDTVRVPRELFASIWTAWRDGYTEGIAQHSGLSTAQVREAWEDMLACLRDPKGYAVWQVPVLRARVP